MLSFLSDLFTWQNILHQLLWAFLMSATLRAALKWLFHKALNLREELAFFTIVPLIFIVTLLAFKHGGSDSYDLQLRIDGINVAEKTELHGSTKVFIFASVRNHGAPTAAEGWTLTATVNNKTYLSEAAEVPDIAVMSNYEKNRIYRADQALYDKTLAPIPRGGIVRGT
jgi:hypothetical protein